MGKGIGLLQGLGVTLRVLQAGKAAGVVEVMSELGRED